MPNKTEMLSYDHTKYIKGIAIVFVLVSHIGNYSGKTWFTPLGGIGVSMFLFCSGFGLMSSYRNNQLSHFWIKRIRSVYMPFVIIETIAACLIGVNFSDYILDILLLKTLNPYEWYMQYIVICYLLFFCSYRFCSKKIVRNSIWVGFSIATFIFCGNLQGEQSLSFILGIYISDHINDISIYSRSKKICLGVILLISSAILLLFKQSDFLRQQSHYIITLLNLVMKCSAMIGIVFLTNFFRLCVKNINFLGNISYPLYLIHAHLMWIISQNLTGYYW